MIPVNDLLVSSPRRAGLFFAYRVCRPATWTRKAYDTCVVATVALGVGALFFFSIDPATASGALNVFNPGNAAARWSVLIVAGTAVLILALASIGRQRCPNGALGMTTRWQAALRRAAQKAGHVNRPLAFFETGPVRVVDTPEEIEDWAVLDENVARWRRYEKAAQALARSGQQSECIEAVYALEQIADEWNRIGSKIHRDACIDQLCLHLRHDSLTGDEEARRTVMDVIQRHLLLDGYRDPTRTNWSDRDYRFTGADLYHVDFSNAHINGFADFSGVHFHGFTSFVGATFHSPLGVNFGHARLGLCDFLWARFDGPVDFTGAYFGADPSFQSVLWADGVPEEVRLYWRPRDDDESLDALQWRSEEAARRTAAPNVLPLRRHRHPRVAGGSRRAALTGAGIRSYDHGVTDYDNSLAVMAA